VSKICTKCHESKPLDQFGKDSRRRDGLQGRCKPCTNAANRVSYAANPERHAPSRRAYRAAHPDQKRIADRRWRAENPKKVNAAARKWRSANPEKSRAASHRWAALNPESVTANSRAYQAANREARATIDHRRRARKRGNGIFAVTAAEIAAMLAEPCYICGTAPSEHVDHIIAIARGGRHSVGNLAGACATCNQQKSDGYLIELKRRRLAA